MDGWRTKNRKHRQKVNFRQPFRCSVFGSWIADRNRGVGLGGLFSLPSSTMGVALSAYWSRSIEGIEAIGDARRLRGRGNPGDDGKGVMGAGVVVGFEAQASFCLGRINGGRLFAPRYTTFQHVAQRVLALDGHPSGGAGSDSDDWLKDSRSTSQISGRRLSAGLLGRGRIRSDYRRSQRVFRFLLQFDRTRRCLRAELHR